MIYRCLSKLAANQLASNTTARRFLMQKGIQHRTLFGGVATSRTWYSRRRYSEAAMGDTGKPAAASSGTEDASSETPKKSRLKDLKHKRAVQRAQFKDEAEVNFFSPQSVFVIVLAAGVFYALYSIDQKKHEGISWFKGSWSQYFSSRNTLEDFVKYRQQHKFTPLPRNITGTQIFINHFKNLVTLEGNEEGLYSKFWNYVSMPEKFLLAPMKQNITMRTLVIDVDTVIHSTWHREKGFQRTQRPGYKAFIREMVMSGYEVILWSGEEQMDWEEHQAVLDDTGLVQGMLWGKDLYYYNNHACKNLLGLNRRMNNVILLDSQARSCQLQPENAILLSPWRGENKNDTELKDIAEFLKFIAKADFQDVRQVLEEYRSQHIPTAFKEKFIQFLQSGG